MSFVTRLVAVITLAGFGVMGNVPALADWPRFRGPDGHGRDLAAKPPVKWSVSENLAWKTPLPGAGSSSPVVVGDRVYVVCYTGDGQSSLTRHLVSIRKSDGATAWTKDIPGKVPEQKTIREGHGYATNTLAIEGNRIYAFFGISGAYAFDLKDGRQIWKADCGDGLNGWGSAASPVVVGDLVLINASVESESLIALNKADGKEVWRARGIRESWNTPIVVTPAGKKAELAVAIFGKILGFNPATGDLLWSSATDIPWYMAPSMIAEGDIVYALGGRPGSSLAVRSGGSSDVTASHRLWTSKKGSNVSSPVFHDGRLFWAHDNLGMAFCADAKTGKVLYEQRLDRADQFYASAVLADGRVYHVDRSGRTFVVAARPEFELLATNDLRDGSRFNASPALDGNQIFLRSDRFLYAIGR